MKRIISMLLVFSTLYISAMFAMAHSILLDIQYEPCIVDCLYDGDDETWYVLSVINSIDPTTGENIYCEYHLPESTSVIKYYFSETAKDDPWYTWTTDIYKEYRKIMTHEDALMQSEIIAAEIMEAYATSMKKWNNVYYYTYNESGERVKNKIVTVIEGTETDHNLIIYPIDYRLVENEDENNQSVTYVACAGTAGEADRIDLTDCNPLHRHYQA